MKKPIKRSAKRAGSIDAAQQKFSIPFVLSLMGHVILCLLFIGLPHFGFEHRISSRVINVQLVSMSTPSPARPAAPEKKAPAPKKVSEVAPEPKPAVTAASKSKETVSLAPKKFEKKISMKHKTYKPERVVQSAIKNVEKRVESTKPDPIQQALDRIQTRLKEENKPASTADSEDETSTGSDRDGKPISDIQQLYYSQVAFYIQKNWAFSEQMAGGETGLFNEVVIKIMRNGDIKDIWFDRRSGNSYFDDSTYKAVLKSSPLPPIPDGIPGSSMELGIHFTPEGLN